ncbi:hypothetical protein [Actinomadura chibensis]|uniref:Uncharacterized protein n=1 Tax=Actinomadura chibensis TaxID=392828 RepID=A0A5D0NI57_9ACTN|nr:hypothetical protein [Actinomadura chibensis]TYB44048.1 hypothetical protein FXF69_24110 [Actinomadura chibensis]
MAADPPVDGVRTDDDGQPFQRVDKPAEKEGPEEAPPAPELPPVNQLINIFNNDVEASGANFGFGEGASRASRQAVSGPMPRDRVDALTRHFVAPEPFEAADEALRKHSVVTLTGPDGVGKVTGAVNLLVEVLGPEAPIVKLSPTRSLRELAARAFDERTGYLLPGWFGVSDQEAEHHWERVQGELCEKGSFLVVTSSEENRRTAVTARIEWCPPGDLAAVVRAHAGDGPSGPSDADIAKLVEALPEAVTMASLVEITELLVRGLPPEEAISSVLRRAAQERVREWFEGKPTRDEVLDVTVLAFLPGLSERLFGECRELLKAELAMTVPVPVPAEPAAADPAERPPGAAAGEAFPQARGRQLENPLIGIRQVSVDGRPRRVIELREEEARRFVFAEMTGRFDEHFWDAVRAWLERILIEPEFALRIAAGLARLAASSFDEVEGSYLVPWSVAMGRGEPARSHARQRRLTTVHVLWFMCFDEDLAPVALRVAEGWTGRGSTYGQRYNAIIAFSGVLGRLFPLEAVKNLWRLAGNRGAVLGPLAVEAFGGLFLSQEDAAGRVHVVQFLENKIRKLRGVPGKIEMYGAALRAMLAVYRTDDPQGRPLAARLLCERPDLADAFGYTWSVLLVNRPVRHAALAALHANLDALRHHSEEPERIAQRLGDVLGGLLTEEQQDELAKDFTALAESPANRRDGTNPVTAALFAAIERARRRMGEQA